MVISVRALTESLLDHYRGREQISYQELKAYLKSVTPSVDYAAPDMTFEKYLKMCMERNKVSPVNSDICSEDRYKKLLDITRNASFFKRFPNKDELYTICIALSVSYDDFIILRQCIEREMKDSATYADNDYTSRDTKIQSVIRDIDDWYANVRKKYPKNSIEQAPEMVLIEVNKMLEENSYAPVYR